MFGSSRLQRIRIAALFANLPAVLAGCSWQSSAASGPEIPYRIGAAQGVSVQWVEGRHILQGEGRFRLVLQPAEADAWNMESVSVLGLMVKNTGETELVLDLTLANENATGWSNSAPGRTIVKAGEELPLAVVLRRTSDYAGTHPAYLRMSGKPDGKFRHWHTIDPLEVKNLVIAGNQEKGFSFELTRMFPLQEINEALMGVFPFIDEYGQYIHKEWPDKAYSDKDLVAGIEVDKKLEEELGKPTGFSKYGGWEEGPRFEATGFFRTQKHEGRWWFVDPEGNLFWSYGANTVGVEYAGQTPTERDPAVFRGLPDRNDEEFGQFYTKLDVEDNYELLEDVPHYDYSRANLYRKYGEDWAERYVERDIARLKYSNLNTIGAWSDNEIAARKQVPYTVMLHYEYAFAGEKLPDPFDSETRAGLRKAIREYPVDFKDDPWCLGAFVNNELHWKNDSRRLVAEILGFEAENTEAKKVFRAWLKDKYTTIDALNEAWKSSFADWDDLLKTPDESMPRNVDAADAAVLATLFADAFFKMVREELTAWSPNVLYLGSRMNSASVDVVKAAARHVDVISGNVYSYAPHSDRFGTVDKPLLISEFHFVNTAGNNLGSGLRSAQDAVQQGRLLQSFIAAAVDHPQIVGAHWFQWRDQSVGGRYDGENYDVGFFDVVDLPNIELIRAAEESGRHLYSGVK